MGRNWFGHIGPCMVDRDPLPRNAIEDHHRGLTGQLRALCVIATCFAVPNGRLCAFRRLFGAQNACLTGKRRMSHVTNLFYWTIYIGSQPKFAERACFILKTKRLLLLTRSTLWLRNEARNIRSEDRIQSEECKKEHRPSSIRGRPTAQPPQRLAPRLGNRDWIGSILQQGNRGFGDNA